MTTFRFLIPPVAALVAVLSLAGCGYKAPLYLPKPKPESQKAPAVMPPDPAPQRPVPAESSPQPG